MQNGYDNSTAIEDIRSFLKRFKEKEESLIDFKVRHEIALFQQFFTSFIKFDQIAIQLIANDAPKYNLFDILGIGHLEAKVHTPFLANLLRPNDTHRQKRLFFDAFMKMIFKERYKPTLVSDIEVKVEVSDSENGRMDIFLLYKENGTGKGLVIENKVYHHDGERQLLRYHKILSETYRFKEGHFHIVYLTPNKTMPSERSIDADTYKSLQSQGAITVLGYKADIVPLLHETLDQITAPIVKETIKQYLKTIKSL